MGWLGGLNLSTCSCGCMLCSFCRGGYYPFSSCVFIRYFFHIVFLILPRLNVSEFIKKISVVFFCFNKASPVFFGELQLQFTSVDVLTVGRVSQ